jgi:glycosyltransferase involved in cell wall biosynthesis
MILNTLSLKINKCMELLATILADCIVTEAIIPRFEKRPRGSIPKKLQPGLRYIDLELFKPLKGVMQRENIIGFIGRLEEEKGIMDFIKIMPIVAKALKNDVRFYIVGGGILEPQIKNVALKFLSKGIDVKFYGFLEHDLLPYVLNEMKILLLPYKSPLEGVPTVLLEAFACGTPIIAYNFGIIGCIIINGKTGYLVPQNSYSDLAITVINILTNPTSLNIISQNERKIATTYFSYKAAINRYSALMQRLLVK